MKKQIHTPAVSFLLIANCLLPFAYSFSQPAHQWAYSIGSSTASDESRSIAVDGIGNVHITGNFTGTADFDPGAGTANLTSAGSADIFVAKYTSAGAYLWAFNISSIGLDEGWGIAVDDSGNVHITGYFTGTADFDPGAGTANLSSATSTTDIFVAKYTSAGDYLWAFDIGSTTAGSPTGYGIAIDSIGNVHITGNFRGTADFDPGAGTANLTSAGSADIFVAKYTSAGAYLWAFNIGSTGVDEGYCIAVDGSGNVLVTGAFRGTADFDPGAGGAVANLTAAIADIFVAKYTSAGAYLWAFDIGSATAGSAAGYGIAIDGIGNVHITGYFTGTADFDPSGSTANLSSAGSTDIFAAKYDSAGTYVWAFRIGGGTTGVEFGNGIVLDGSGNVHITGNFTGTADFDPGAGMANLTSAGGNDIFAVEYTSAGTYLCAGSMGGTADDVGYAIYMDGSGNIHITGSFASAPADFDPGTGTANLSSTGSNDIFYAKYSNCAVLTPVELLYFNAFDIITIYPNPSANGCIQYTIGSETGGKVTVKVIDMLGREVLSKEETLEGGVATKKVETQNFASGTYLLQITTKAQEKTQKQFVIK